MAQRLVRKICTACIGERTLTPEEAASLRLSVPKGKRIKVKEGHGCHECRGTGFRGRSGVFEILTVDDSVKQLIIDNKDSPEIKREAVRHGMRTLRQSALRKLAEGLTTFEEVVRVTGI
jgi:general secretion pathway protein E